MRLYHLVFGGLFFLTANLALAQDDSTRDPPQENQEAKEVGPRGKKQKAGQGKGEADEGSNRPGSSKDSGDDVPQGQKQAAEHDAGRKSENAIPDNLADALAKALRNSPAILVADAKVRQAQAELNEVRLSVVQELTLTFQRRASNKADLAHHEATATKLVEKGYAKEASTDAITKLRQAILEDETRTLYLLGVGAEPSTEVHAGGGAGGGAGMMAGGMMGMRRGPGMGMMSGAGAMGGMPGMAGGMSGGPMGSAGAGPPMMGRVAGPTAKGQKKDRASDLPENVRPFLDKRLDVQFDAMPLPDVLAYLKEAGGGDVAFIIQSPEEWKPSPDGSEGHSITLSLKQVTVRSLLQALADLHHCAFVFRDYGILVLGPDVEETEPFDSFRASGTPMVAPPSSPAVGGMGGMGGGGAF